MFKTFKSGFRVIWSLIRSYKKTVVILAALNIFLAIINGIVPYFTGDYAEDIWKLKQSILTLTIEFLKLKVALLLKQIK